MNVPAIDVDRVFQLYSLKGSLAADVAFSMGITISQVRSSLRVRERKQRATHNQQLAFERKADAFDFSKSDGVYICARTSGAFQYFCQISGKKT